MTVQVKDKFKVLGEKYDLVALSDYYFRPDDYGLIRDCSHSSCWRGFFCEVHITNERGMILHQLHITGEGNEEIPINGKYISPNGVYENVDMPLSYNGKMLFGADQKYYGDTYLWEPAWVYRRLIEIEFTDGKIKTITDLSKMTKRFQRSYRISKKTKKAVICNEYEDGTGNYETKLWWLEYTPSCFVDLCMIPVDCLLSAGRIIQYHTVKLYTIARRAIATAIRTFQEKSEAKYNERNFVFLRYEPEKTDFYDQYDLDQNADSAQIQLKQEFCYYRLKEYLNTPEKKKVLIISPEAFISKFIEYSCRERLVKLGFSPRNISIVSGSKVKKRRLFQYDYLYIPNGDPFALVCYINERLKCAENIKKAIRRGLVCIAVGESAVACGNTINISDSGYSNSVYLDKDFRETSFGLHFYAGDILLADKLVAKEETQEDEVLSSNIWEPRKLVLPSEDICIVNGDEEQYGFTRDIICDDAE